MAGKTLFTVVFAIYAAVASAAALEPRQKLRGHWVDLWATMPQLVEPHNMPNAPFNQTNVVFQNSTLRQTIQLSLPAKTLRLRFSNAFANTDVKIDAVTIAFPPTNAAGGKEIRPETVKSVTFDEGSSSITIAKGALAVSDPVNFEITKAQTVVAITIYFKDGQTGGYQTGHPGSRTNSWMGFGNQVGSVNITGPEAVSTAHWYYLSAVEAWLGEDKVSFAIVGDSITDGRGSTTDANNRWPDLLLTRLIKSKRTDIAIANQAAGGNRILADGLGPNALARIERDVIAHSGVNYVQIYIGVNDIGGAATDAATQKLVGDRVINAYKQMITRIHAVGLPVFGTTITPFCAPPANASVQPYSDAERERTRQRVNEWIRNSGRFDAVIDFDKFVRDPTNGTILKDEYNSGDYLHLSVAGYQRFADQFPVKLFDQFPDGVTRLV